MTTVTVLETRAPIAREALAKLQRRAARYGQAIEWAECARDHVREFVRPDGERVKALVPVVDFTVSGEAPRVGAFTLEAALERTPGGVIVSAAPGVSVGKLGRSWDGRCDHCGSTRARVHGFVVAKGRTRKVVGRSCLRDYLGTDTPDGLLSRFDMFREIERAGEGDEESWGCGWSYRDLTLGLIAQARAAIALFGWRPSAYEGYTTAAMVYDLARPIRDHNRAEQTALRLELRTNAARYHAEAEAVVEWARNLRPGRSDYLHNLKVACSGEVVNAKHAGLVISASAAYDKQKALEDERAAKRAADPLPASEWVGAPGERLRNVAVELRGVRVLPDYGYGESYVYSFVTAKGERLTWKTGSAPYALRKAKSGDRFSLTAAVKEHAEFRDVKETRVSRAKLEGAA